MRLAPLASVIEPRLVQALIGSMATDEFASIVMWLDAVVVNVVAAIVTESPLATSIVPVLVKTINSIESSPCRRSVDRAAVGEGVPADTQVTAGLVDHALIDDFIARRVARTDRRRADCVEGDAGREG